jgi:hypothetical protein
MDRLVNDPDFRPELSARYLQFVQWKRGLDPGYAPTMADLALLAAENARTVYATAVRKPAVTAAPDDLITTAVAVSRFHVSRWTLTRAIENGLRSYRAANSAPNATHRFSTSDLERRFPAKA